MRKNDRPDLVCVRVTEDTREVLLGETVAQVQDKWLILDEAGQRRQRLPEALAGNLEEPAGPKGRAGAVAHCVPSALRDALAREDGNLANATILEPVQRVSEERAVRDGGERRRGPASVTIGVAGK